MSIATELAKLKALRRSGDLSEVEYDRAKARVLGEGAGEAGGHGLTRALWALVIAVLVGAAAVVVLLDGLSESLRVVAGSAVLVAGTLGGILGVAEDLSVLMVGGLAVGAVAIAAIAFTGAAPVLVLVVLAAMAVGAVVSWFGDVF